MSGVNEGNRAVLVTGGRGFIGRHLVKSLVCGAAVRRVVSIDIVDISEPSFSPETVVEVKGDIRNTSTMEELFASYAFDTVYDLASYTLPGLSKSEYQCNIDMTQRILDYVERHNVSKYIFFSTQFTFRKPGVLPADDQDFAPAENYGSSKVESEILIRSRLSPERWLILRPTYIWGPGLVRFRDGLLYRLNRGQFLIPSEESLVRYYGYVETAVEQARRFGDMEFNTLPRKVYYLTDDAITLRRFCNYLIDAMGRGRAYPVPSTVIKLLGLAGGLASKAGISFPISPLQATEMTTNYPVPADATLALTSCTTDYTNAARKTVEWAVSFPSFVN